MKIIIGADLVPTESNYKYFESGNVERLIGKDLFEKLKLADYTIFNLEIPLTNTVSPIEKCGPNLIAPTATIVGLQKINPHFFTLANNHIMDQGMKGLEDTIQVLDQAGISYAGVGSDLEYAQAAASYIVNLNGVRVGIYCCAENEFSIADVDTPGVNPFDPLESLDHVINLKKNCDYLIVLYHGGKEHYRYPSPYLQKVCRKLVSKGADLVVCQHSHCIGAEEQWQEGQHCGTIVYGQGNFLFDRSDSEFWQTGLLIELDIDRGDSGLDVNISYVPIHKVAETVRLATKDDASDILNAFELRSEELTDSGLLEKKYQQFADSMLGGYLSSFSGKKSMFYRIVNKLTGYRFGKWKLKRKYRKKERISIINYVECEAHRELLLKGLKNKFEDDKQYR